MVVRTAIALTLCAAAVGPATSAEVGRHDAVYESLLCGSKRPAFVSRGFHLYRSGTTTQVVIPATEEFAELTNSEIMFAFHPVDEIPRPDFVTERRAQGRFQDLLNAHRAFEIDPGSFPVSGSGSTEPIVYESLTRFVPAYEKFLASHETKLQRQAHADDLHRQLLAAHAEYRQQLEELYDTVFYWEMIGPFGFRETLYSFEAKGMKLPSAQRIRRDDKDGYGGLIFDLYDAAFDSELLLWQDTELFERVPFQVANREEFESAAIPMDVETADALIRADKERQVSAALLFRNHRRDEAWWFGGRSNVKQAMRIEVLGVRIWFGRGSEARELTMTLEGGRASKAGRGPEDACDLPFEAPEQSTEPLPNTARGVIRPRIVHRVEPVHPASAKESKPIKVLLTAVVEPDGTVGEVSPVAWRRPPVLFEEAAMEAVRQWRYEPALLRGRPVRLRTVAVVEFAP